MPTSMPTKMITAKMRMNIVAEIGRSGPCLFGGTVGSSRPTTVIFRGGPPPREEDVCVSGNERRGPRYCSRLSSASGQPAKDILHFSRRSSRRKNLPLHNKGHFSSSEKWPQISGRTNRTRRTTICVLQQPPSRQQAPQSEGKGLTVPGLRRFPRFRPLHLLLWTGLGWTGCSLCCHRYPRER